MCILIESVWFLCCFIFQFYQQRLPNWTKYRRAERYESGNSIFHEKNNIVSLLCVLCMHPLRGSSPFLFFLSSLSLSFSLSVIHFPIIHRDETTRDRSSNRFHGYIFLLVQFSSNRVEPCLQSFTKSLSKSIVGGNAWWLHAKEIYGRLGVERSRYEGRRKERTNEEETNETNGFFGILFPGG